MYPVVPAPAVPFRSQTCLPLTNRINTFALRRVGDWVGIAVVVRVGVGIGVVVGVAVVVAMGFGARVGDGMKL